MQNEHPLHLLIVDDNLNDAEAIISDLRSAGIALRGFRAESIDAAVSIIEEKPIDIFVCSTTSHQLPLTQAIDTIRRLKKDIALLALNDKHDADLRRKAMRAGAKDLISKDDREHAKLVIQREYDNANHRRMQRNNEIALREINKRCHSLLESSRDAITYIHGGMHIYANPVYLEQFGFGDLDDISGTTFMDLVAKSDHPKFKDLLRRLDSAEQQLETVELMLSANGKEFAAVLEFSPASFDGEPCTQVVIRRQIVNDDLEQKLVNLRQRDVLTGLYNRHYFMELLTEATTQGRSGALLYVDIDGFGRTRDSVGIAASDLVLIEITNVLKTKLDPSWHIARFNDHSFTVLMPGQTAKDAETIAESLRRTIEEDITDIENQTISVSASIGISLIGNDGTSPQTLIEQALDARQKAVLAGGNKVIMYQIVKQASVEDTKAEDQEWGQRIMDAFSNKRFYMVFLPIANLHGDGGEKYEALLRMTTATGEPISPSTFLPAAERQGLMRDIDRWIIREVIVTLSARRQAGKNTMCFVKLSAPSLQDESLLPWLSDQFSEHKVPPDFLVFEMTESIVVTHAKEAKNMTRALKQLRCGILIDQFGSGLNSFQLLKTLSVDYVKLDGTLTTGLARNSQNQENLKQVVSTAHQASKLVVVGNVEDAPNLAVLWQLGINYIQGFFLQEPTQEMNYDFSEMVM